MSQRIRKTTSSLWSTLVVFILAFVFYAVCNSRIQ